MKKDLLATELGELRKEIAEIKGMIGLLMENQRQRKIPAAADAPNPLGKKKCFNHKLFGGFKDPGIRKMVLDLREKGCRYMDIESAVKTAFPENSEKHISRSAAQRFCEAARKGRLSEYGIKITV